MLESATVEMNSITKVRPENAKELAKHCAQLAFEKKAMNATLIDLQGRSTIADYFLVLSAQSSPQVEAIGSHILRELKDLGFKRCHHEGMSEGRWALIDLGDVIIHIFQEAMRDFYNLEGLWVDAPQSRVEEKR